MQASRMTATWPLLVGMAIGTLGIGGNAVLQADQGSAAADFAVDHANALSLAFSSAADKIRPSVVSIRALKHVQPAGFDHPQLPPDVLRRFFGDRMPPLSPPHEMPPQQGVGSGVIVRADGYILTNNHVVGDADEVVVVLHDGRELEAKVVGTDPMSDVAVIRIEADALPAAQLGDSGQLRVGEWVVAAGNPFGLSDSITAGIVSAKGRANVNIAEYEDFIQTDAAINPGNSGGPLVNLKGEVIGINTAIASRSGGNNGVGFAIPINMARNIMDSLIEDGQVSRGWLGVALQPLTEPLAKSFGYDGNAGVLLSDVLAGGPAERAGLRAGDIVKGIDGLPIATMAELRNRIAQSQPGATVALDVFRDGSTLSLNVKLGKRNADGDIAASAPSAEEYGLRLRSATPDELRSLGHAPDTAGVLVDTVSPGSAAARAGLRPGDLILSVQGANVGAPAEFQREMAKHDVERGVRLLVKSASATRFVLLQANTQD